MEQAFKTTESRLALTRHCHHIRSVQAVDPAFVPKITQLQSLTLRLLDNPSSLVTELIVSPGRTIPLLNDPVTKGSVNILRSTRSVAMVLSNNRDLQTVNLDAGCLFPEKGDNITTESIHFISTLPVIHLKKLEISFQGLPKIEGASDALLLDKEKMLEFLQHQTPLVALKEIIITGNRDGGNGNISPDQLFFLLKCPNLETLRLNRLDDITMRVLPRYLSFVSHKLACLEWRKGLFDIEEDIVNLIQTSRIGWKELRLPDMPQFGDDGFSALMEHVETLEILRLESAELLTMHRWLDLLCSAKKLRRLEGIADRQRKRFTMGYQIYAQYAFEEHFGGLRGDRSWALGPSMTYLQLEIMDVPRPDVLFNQSRVPIFQEGLNPSLRYDVQRWIYTQLARMTNLETLVLGLMDLSVNTLKSLEIDYSMGIAKLEEEASKVRVTMFNYDSLEFSLESGLDLLKNMTELRVLDVRWTAHNIGVKELEWMHIHWPKLEKIRGLETDWRWSERHAKGADMKAAVDAWMSDHPKGIGSSFY
ncbi:hypothetical protein FBU30_009135 [Linnemannia zychae]|nr:hypothetical protein FBU30_009135 [Linnemannia zychae]